MFNTILDTLDGLRKLDPPKESGGEREQVKWFEKFSQIMKSMPSVPDVDRLSRFSDGLGKMLAKLNRNLAAPPEREEPFERLYGVQGGKITALYTLAGAAWTTSRGYPVYATVNPCHADGTAANVALTRGVALPLQASRATAVGDVVQWIVGIGTYDVGAVTIHGVVLAGIVPDVGLPVYDDAATGKMLHVRLSWNTSVEPDTKFGYKTGWVIESDNHDCFERIGESET
ncbi:hypothetical protein IMZ48_30575, partial [Candidatus Bathyarchaeota archaeon]|nr:hypothetical protein [Candidatus Bathyarchaeota archaeon]